MNMLKNRVVRVCLTSTVTRNLHRERVIDTTRNDDKDKQEVIGIDTITEFIEGEKPVNHLRLKFISEGLLPYKMLVDYEENGKEKHHEAHGSKSSILIPDNATKIKVRFQVMRAFGVWCDVKEYDRFKKCWIEPTKPHIFEYDTPVSCTYTLDGNLFYEAVMKVSGDDKALNYSRKSPCFSKMLVDYEENGEKKHREGGSGSLILIPENATKIEVRFQVKRARGVWSDVKEYDGWIEPIKPLIFKYDRPKDCEYILARNFFHEKDTHQVRGSEATTSSSIQDIGTQVKVKGLDELEMDEKKKLRDKKYLEEMMKMLKQGISIEEKIRLKSVISQRQDKDVYGEDSLSFISSQEGPTNNEWFEENVFDENGDIKEVYVHELRSERFSWIKDFHIGIDEEKKSWQMSITYARNTEPCMKNLKNLFGDNIASFVDFIRESDDEDEERLRTSSCFLRAPSSGDNLYVQNEERGTITVLAAQVRSNKKHYAITSYHVCYCFNDLPENIFEAHKKLKEDCSNDAAGCIGSRYQYMDEETVLGVFECGLYDNCNDIALIQLTPELTCVDAIAVLVNEVESQLLSKKQVLEIFKTYVDMGKLPTVKKYGSKSDETEGELFAITTARLPNDMNLGFYKIRGKHADDFARKGDSGALVYIVHESKNLPFAMVSNHKPNGNVYYCPNLHESIEALNEKYSWINIKPCIRQCGRF